MNTEEAKVFIANNEWARAKTMPGIPHEYIVRERVNDDENFNAFIRLIHETGWKFHFYKYFNTYLEIDDKYYWTMEEPVEETTIINRANLDDYEIRPRYKKS